ncbi:MAG TPA: hypothetical protein VF153_02335 [Candidatus Limnocylindria bacterium]
MHAQPITPSRFLLAIAGAAVAAFASVGIALAAPETICGRVDAVSATDATVDGRAVPLAGLDAQAIGALQLAFNGGLDACVDVDSTGATVNQAFAVTVTFDQCGRVRPGGGSDVMVDRVIIPPVLLDAETFEALEFAMSINGSACLAIDVTGSNGVSSVDAQLDMEVCGTVTDKGPGSVELNGKSFDVAAGVDLDDPDEGDVICVVVSSAAGGGVEVIARTDDHDEDDGGAGEVPDTAMAPSAPLAPQAAGLALLSLGLGLAITRRRRQLRVRA